MKVLKFGGTSVGSVETIMNIKKIVKAEKEPLIVVVSAVGGITDKLIYTSGLASRGDLDYKLEYRQIIEIHRDLIIKTVPQSRQEFVMDKVSGMLEDLGNILQGIYLIRDLSPKTSSLIVSYGERISSFFLAQVLEAKLFDSMKFIKTNNEYGRHIVNFDATSRLIRETFARLPKLSLVPGFISSDSLTGDITNLGRGGSDYTASLIAAELNAEALEIWTDVDGFMTADPKVISSAYVIDTLSFTEAMELCNFGAKVIYPPTIYPIYHKNIPIRIRNTFNPETPGTYISRERGADSGRAIKGISSINDTSLITVQGLGMVGVIGVNYRIFKTLAGNGISVFMVSQASSENNTSLAVKTEDADLAVKALNDEFAQERALGAISDITIERELATVSIVGENMKRTPGVAGKLFGTLGRAGISVITCAQGASETNISFVIRREYLRKALNSIHDSFFLSEYKVLNIFIAGVGTVGSKLLEQIRDQQATLKKNKRLKLCVVGIANSSKRLLCREGINLDNCIDRLKSSGVTGSSGDLCREIVEMNIFNAVFVDCTASDEIAGIYGELLKNNVSVVAANKVAASSEYENYLHLKDIARRRDIKYLFETNVGAGLPIINTMNALINSGDHIMRLEAVLSGSLNFIFNTLSAEIPLSRAIMMAKEARYAEPDPRIDLSGKDVVRKLVILAREAGYQVEQSDVKINLFIPEKYFEGSLDDFWKNISKLDDEFETMRRRVETEKKHIRLVAKMDNGKCEVGLQEVDRQHPFYELEGSNNIVMISTERYKDYPMIIKGYGAGDDVTAAGVFADIISVVNIR
jgi:aspartokinase/homoserine dehydrogenase 1